MFLAMGIGAWSAGVFHFMIHAFFKALLFLAGGAVIHLLNDEHDIFRMGGLRKKMPVVFITFLIGSASLSALPLITAGFYSKDQILWFGWISELSNPWLWVAGITGALLTSLYTFRLVFIAFFGDMKTAPSHRAGNLMKISLFVLAFLSIAAGFIELPHNMGRVHLFTNLFQGELPEVSARGESSEFLFQVVSAFISLAGIYLAYRLFYKKSEIPEVLSRYGISRFFLDGWKFDRLYDILFVKPYVWLAKINKNDFIDLFYKSIGSGAGYLNSAFSRTQTGRLRWYVLFFTAGIVIILTIMVTL